MVRTQGVQINEILYNNFCCPFMSTAQNFIILFVSRYVSNYLFNKTAKVFWTFMLTLPFNFVVLVVKKEF